MESSEQKVYYKNLDTAEYRQKSIAVLVVTFIIGVFLAISDDLPNQSGIIGP